MNQLFGLQHRSRTDPVILFSKTSGNVQRVQQKKAVRPATSSVSSKKRLCVQQRPASRKNTKKSVSR